MKLFCGRSRPSALRIFYILLAAVPAAQSSCPTNCNEGPASWAEFDTLDRLEACDKHMLFEVAPQNLLSSASTTPAVTVRACTVADDEELPSSGLTGMKKRDTATNLCVTNASPTSASIDVGTSGDGSNFTDVTANTLAQVSTYMSASCSLKKIFSYSTGAIVGIFAGEAVDNGGSIPSLMAEAIALANGTSGAPQTMYIQRCVSEGSSEHVLGIAMDVSGNLPWVQTAIQSWSNGTCLNVTSSLTGNFSTPEVSNITIYEYSHPAVVLPNITSGGNDTVSSVASGGSTTATLSTSSSLTPATSSLTVPSTATTNTPSPASSPSSSTSGPPTTTAGQSSGTVVYSTPPGPTQTGIVSDCDAFAEPQSGQGCYDFAAAYGITLDELYQWNPAIGDCQKYVLESPAPSPCFCTFWMFRFPNDRIQACGWERRIVSACLPNAVLQSFPRA